MHSITFVFHLHPLSVSWRESTAITTGSRSWSNDINLGKVGKEFKKMQLFFGVNATTCLLRSVIVITTLLK